MQLISVLSYRRIGLKIGTSGTWVTGAEDMALDLETGMLYISAYDRRRQSPGGIYRLPLAALAADKDAFVVSDLSSHLGRPLRPHGMYLLKTRNLSLLFVINRVEAGGRRLKPVIERFEIVGDRMIPIGMPIALPELANANDLIALGRDHLLVTRDRMHSSGLQRFLHDMLNFPGGSVVELHHGRPRTLIRGLRFANGIAVDHERLYVAATRSREIHIFDLAQTLAQGAHVRDGQVMSLGMAPDNLTWGDDGRLYVAGPDSLLALARFRAGHISSDNVGSEVRALNVRPSLSVALSIRERGSHVSSGATVAVKYKGHLLLGAAFDAGLTWCKLGVMA